VIWTDVPAVIQGPAGLDETVPYPLGVTAKVRVYCATQTQVRVEFWEIVKLTEVPVPLDGTSPVPDQPVHTYLVPVGPAIGELIVHVKAVPKL
jgi:hypothetical protein